MYTKEDYIAEKNEMPKQERMIQERFEQLIEVLVMYKQESREKDVYLTDKSKILVNDYNLDSLKKIISKDYKIVSEFALTNSRTLIHFKK